MSDDDPFEDLDQQLQATETDGDDEPDAEPEPDDGSDDAGAAASSDDERAPGGPAFEFDIKLQRSIYARDETWNAFEDTVDFEIQRALRDHGLRDVEGREIHDAMVRVATEHPDAVAELVLDARGIDTDE